jgi:threonyl-tRNA synthetase
LGAVGDTHRNDYKSASATFNGSSEKIGAKIRNAQLEKIPYMLVVGQKEAEEGLVSVRHQKRGDLGTQPVATFLAEIVSEVKERRL